MGEEKMRVGRMGWWSERKRKPSLRQEFASEDPDLMSQSSPEDLADIAWVQKIGRVAQLLGQVRHNGTHGVHTTSADIKSSWGRWWLLGTCEDKLRKVLLQLAGLWAHIFTSDTPSRYIPPGLSTIHLFSLKSFLLCHETSSNVTSK